jgi:hypothetical protein
MFTEVLKVDLPWPGSFDKYKAKIQEELAAAPTALGARSIFIDLSVKGTAAGQSTFQEALPPITGGDIGPVAEWVANKVVAYSESKNIALTSVQVRFVLPQP